MDTQLLGFLLGISVAVIGTLVTALGVLLRRNNHSSHANPNMGTMDEKLNDILLCLTRIETKIGNCPTVVEGSRKHG